MSNIDNKDDEVISVNMSRKDYQILRDMIERERAYNWMKNSLRSFWLWAVIGGILSLLTFGDRIFNYLGAIR